jgi:HPt (histidine-containing phosphotransfer) domain-containing protein
MLTDLTYLKNITNDDQHLIREMINIFVKQIEEYTHDIREIYQDARWMDLSRLAHKVKSSLSIMGMNELSDRMKELEMLAGEGKEPGRYHEYVDQFIRESNQAVKELKKKENYNT